MFTRQSSLFQVEHIHRLHLSLYQFLHKTAPRLHSLGWPDHGWPMSFEGRTVWSWLFWRSGSGPNSLKLVCRRNSGVRHWATFHFVADKILPYFSLWREDASTLWGRNPTWTPAAECAAGTLGRTRPTRSDPPPGAGTEWAWTKHRPCRREERTKTRVWTESSS